MVNHYYKRIITDFGEKRISTDFDEKRISTDQDESVFTLSCVAVIVVVMTATKQLRVNITCSDITHAMLGRMAEKGILGKNRAEIAAYIVNAWLWDNEEKLARQGVPYASATETEASGRRPSDASS